MFITSEVRERIDFHVAARHQQPGSVVLRDEGLVSMDDCGHCALRCFPGAIMRKDKYFDMAFDAKYFGVVVICKEDIDMLALDGASHVFGNAISDSINVNKRSERNEAWINRNGAMGHCQATGGGDSIAGISRALSSGLESGAIGREFAIERAAH